MTPLCARLLAAIGFGVFLGSSPPWAQDIQECASQNRHKVLKVEREGAPGPFQMGDYIRVHVENLAGFLGESRTVDKQPLLYLNGIPLLGLCPSSINIADDVIIFHLARTTGSLAAWKPFYQYPWRYERKVTLSVGFENSCVMTTAMEKVPMILVRKHFYIAAMIILGVLLAGFLWLVATTGMLRDSGIKAPFSLSRTQLAFWTLIISSSFFFIWAVTGNLAPITGSTWILLSISIATTAGAKLIDSNQASDAEKASPGITGFIHDILSDEHGVSIHRFQMVVWTLVLGIVFVRSVIINLELPQLDQNLLLLMGISNGTYLGLKIPENHKPAKADKPAQPEDYPAMG